MVDGVPHGPFLGREQQQIVEPGRYAPRHLGTADRAPPDPGEPQIDELRVGLAVVRAMAVSSSRGQEPHDEDPDHGSGRREPEGVPKVLPQRRQSPRPPHPGCVPVTA
jgi:hypothetical protein